MSKFIIDKSLQTNGNLIVQGDFTVKGSTTTVNQETLTVKDNIIVTNAHGSATPYTGVVSITGNTTKGIVPGTKLIFKDNLPSSLFNNTIAIEGNFESCVEGYSSGNLIIGQNGSGQYIALGDLLGTVPMTDGYIYNTNWVGPYIVTENRYITYIGDSILLLDDSEFSVLSDMFNNITAVDLEEAYASPLYNSSANVIELGKGYINRTDENKVEFAFGAGQAQSLATRSDSLTKNSFLSYNPTTHQIDELQTMHIDVNLEGSGTSCIKIGHRTTANSNLFVGTGSNGVVVGGATTWNTTEKRRSLYSHNKIKYFYNNDNGDLSVDLNLPNPINANNPQETLATQEWVNNNVSIDGNGVTTTTDFEFFSSLY